MPIRIGPFQRTVLGWQRQSLWSGYWERDGCAMRTWAERESAEVHFVHSGGHAWPEDLHRLESAIAPRELMRVHTDSGDPGATA